MRLSSPRLCHLIKNKVPTQAMFIGKTEYLAMVSFFNLFSRNALSEKLDCLISCMLKLPPTPSLPNMFPREGLA